MKGKSGLKSVPSALELMARIVLGGVFIFASSGKIIHPFAFAQVIANYQILPVHLINPAALVLPWIELVCGICLLTGWFKQGGVMLITLLLVVFIAAMGYNLYRGVDISCGCFSISAKKGIGLYYDLVRDIVLLAIAVALLWRSPVQKPKV